MDGFHVASAGALMVGEVGFKACTPYGCMKMLESIGMKDLRAASTPWSSAAPTSSGKPMAMMLLAANATVTITHSGTADLAAMTRQADIVVAAVGKRNVLTADMLKPGAVVIDVGMNRNDEGKLCGDVDFDGCKEVAGYITPVPGGGRPDDHYHVAGQHHGSGRARRRPGLTSPPWPTPLYRVGLAFPRWPPIYRTGHSCALPRIPHEHQPTA